MATQQISVWYGRYLSHAHSYINRRGTSGFAMLLNSLCSVAVNQIPACGVAVISNPMMCNVCTLKSAVFSVMKLSAVLRFPV